MKQFSLRGMLMAFVPTRFIVNSFMRWAGFWDRAGEDDARHLLDLMYLGVKHFRMPTETLRVAANAANPLSDDELRTMHVPVLLLMGDREMIYDAADALARARRLIPDFEGALAPGCQHDMCFSQQRLVDAQVRAFLEKSRTDGRGERSVA